MSAKATVSTEQEFPGQRPGELVQLVFHQHPLVMRKFLVIGMFVMVLGILPLDFPQVYASESISSFCLKFAIGVFLAVLVAWFYRWVGWYYTVYIVTNLRIVEIKQKGLFDRTVTEWQLDKVIHINYRVGGLQAVMFGFGDITVRTVIGDLLIKTVHKPIAIHEKLQHIVAEFGGAKAGGDNSTPFYN